MKASRIVLLAVFCAVAALTSAFAQPGASQADSPPAGQTQPERCKVGIFVVDLHEVDIQKKIFGSSFWLWSLCGNDKRNPLKTIEFVNANSTNAALDATLPRGDQFWSSRKIGGSFRNDFDVRNFPFDRHELTITMEEGVDDTREFQYEGDVAKSGVDPRVKLPGWRVTGFKLSQAERDYNTTFGDPSLPGNASAQYGRLVAEVHIARDSFTSFFKMAAVVYVAATLALLSFLFYLDAPSSFGSRISFLGGSLFATVINMRVSSAELGSNVGMTLIDMIHLTSLTLIITATILTIVADRRLGSNRAGDTVLRDQVRRFDLHNMIICGSVFIVANIVLISHAAIIG
ncbi:MAG: hypothetical protein Q7T81_12550 [Pseudolabrys sp.]|nr:hypothetical protein [Pseudolabrys sp.]